MTADQIAAEAAHILCGNVIHAKDKDWATGIINAAIEKAIKLQMDKDDEMWSAKLAAEREQSARNVSALAWSHKQQLAAAHASEPRCLVCDTELDCPQCRSQRPTCE